MKNRLLIILLALVLAAGMTACSGRSEGPSKDKSGGAKAKQTESVSSEAAEAEEDVQDEAEEAGDQNDAGGSVQEEADLNEFFSAVNENLKEKITADDVAETGKGKYAVIFGNGIQMEAKGSVEKGDLAVNVMYDDGTDGIEEIVHAVVFTIDEEAATAVDVMLDDFAHSDGKYPDYRIGRVNCSYEKDDSGFVTIKIEQINEKKA